MLELIRFEAPCFAVPANRNIRIGRAIAGPKVFRGFGKLQGYVRIVSVAHDLSTVKDDRYTDSVSLSQGTAGTRGMLRALAGSQNSGLEH
jgi:hypothetical protein